LSGQAGWGRTNEESGMNARWRRKPTIDDFQDADDPWLAYMEAIADWKAEEKVAASQSRNVSRWWHPNGLQWCIIWVAALIAAHFWLDLDISGWWGGRGGGWGLSGYLSRVNYRNRTEFAVTILAIGALLVWQASGWRRKK
jgi:hypothetical protein